MTLGDLTDLIIIEFPASVVLSLCFGCFLIWVHGRSE